MAARTLIRGATVITLDRQGDLPEADILVSGDAIQEIAPRIQADDAEAVPMAWAFSQLQNGFKKTWCRSTASAELALVPVSKNISLPSAQSEKYITPWFSRCCNTSEKGVGLNVSCCDSRALPSSRLATWLLQGRPPPQPKMQQQVLCRHPPSTFWCQ